jgi:PPOX class probable F420-dependent enzyme
VGGRERNRGGEEAAADGSQAGPGWRTRVFRTVSGATHVQLTTFRRDGRAVPTSLHLVVDSDAAFFRTWDVAGKAKRLRHTSAVRIAPATFRGRPLGPAIPAQARLLGGPAAERAARLLAARHPILHGRLIPWLHRRLPLRDHDFGSNLFAPKS